VVDLCDMGWAPRASQSPRKSTSWRKAHGRAIPLPEQSILGLPRYPIRNSSDHGLSDPEIEAGTCAKAIKPACWLSLWDQYLWIGLISTFGRVESYLSTIKTTTSVKETPLRRGQDLAPAVLDRGFFLAMAAFFASAERDAFDMRTLPRLPSAQN
jgi:hypothetical protein